MCERSLQDLQRLTNERLTANALDRVESRNQRHRERITRKVESYFGARQRVLYLQHQNTALCHEITQQRQYIRDMKRQLSKETSKFANVRRIHAKELSDIRLSISRANQRIQRRLRHVSYSRHFRDMFVDSIQERRERPLPRSVRNMST